MSLNVRRASSGVIGAPVIAADLGAGVVASAGRITRGIRRGERFGLGRILGAGLFALTRGLRIDHNKIDLRDFTSFTALGLRIFRFSWR